MPGATGSSFEDSSVAGEQGTTTVVPSIIVGKPSGIPGYGGRATTED